MNLFDDKGRWKNGKHDLNVWPFYKTDARLGCFKEYNGINSELKKKYSDLQEKIHLFFTKLVIQLESFAEPMIYSSRDEKQLHLLSKTIEDEEDTEKLTVKSMNKHPGICNNKHPLVLMYSVPDAHAKSGKEIICTKC
jgi:hypothetical protein